MADPAVEPAAAGAGGAAGEAAPPSNALEESLQRKGTTSYYFAHKSNLGARQDPVFHGPPKLLGVSGPVDDSPKITAINKYSWGDGTKSVSVYVPLKGVHTVDTEEAVDIDWAARTVTLSVTLGARLHRLKLQHLTDDITNCTMRVKDDTLVLRLRKGTQFKWSALTKAPPASEDT